MTKANARRVFRPQGLAVILGMGALSVALVGLVVATMGGSIPAIGELAIASAGMIGGAKVVLAAA
jgi:hypothetical protein